jgi:hypothetical protein
MIKVLTVIAFGVILSGCQTTQPNLVRTEYKVVRVPEEFLRTCRTTPRLPRYSNLTEIQVAQLLSRLHQNNVTCVNAMEQIRKYDEEAARTIENNK